MKKQMLRLLLLTIAMLAWICYPEKKAFAAGNEVEVVAVAYSDESIIVKNNNNKKIYFATEMDAGRGNWDMIEVGTGDVFTVIDFSYLSPNMENILKIKGDLDTTPSRVIINKRPQKLEVSINYSNFDSSTTVAQLLNIRSTEGTGQYPITMDDLQWKKGADGEWLDSDDLKTALLRRYLLKGTNLYFRTTALNDVAKVTAPSGYTTSMFLSDSGSYSYKNAFAQLSTAQSTLAFDPTSLPDGTEGRRPGAEVRLKINKQASTPVTKVDGSEFTMDIDYGQEYRISLDGGLTYNNWTQVTDRTGKPLKLKDMLNDGSNGLTDSFPAMAIDVRDYSTAKAASSRIVTTNIPTQRVIAVSAIEGTPTVADNNVYVSYNGVKNLIVTIPSATEDYPYEYTVVKSGSSLDIERAVWVEISKNTPVKIASTKAADGSTVYFRKKEIKFQAETRTHAQVDFQMASTYATFAASYPSLPVAPKMTYIYTKGYSGDIQILIPLNVAGRKPFENHVKSVKLGTKELPFTLYYSPSLPGSMSPSVVNYMRIDLTGTELAKMANCTARSLSIYYDNGTVDKTSSKLTIKNPTDAGTLFMTATTDTVTNKTLVSVASLIPSGNHLVYTITAAQISGKKTEDKTDSSYTDLDSTGIIDTAGKSQQWLTVYEVTTPAVAGDPSYIVRLKSVQLP